MPRAEDIRALKAEKLRRVTAGELRAFDSGEMRDLTGTNPEKQCQSPGDRGCAEQAEGLKD
ncbi:MAG: hypothetical protein ACOY4I_02060 [Bacillota bacterium]